MLIRPGARVYDAQLKMWVTVMPGWQTENSIPVKYPDGMTGRTPAKCLT